MKSTSKDQRFFTISKIVLIYSFFGIIWTYFSDFFFRLFIKDPSLIKNIDLFKDIGIVLFTAVLIYFTFSHNMKKMLKSEKLLRRSEERFRQIAQNSGEIIWEVDDNYRFTYVNPVVEIILGYKPDEVINKMVLFDTLDPKVRAGSEIEMRKRLDNKIILERIETICRHKDGRKVILETNASPVISSKGILIGYRGADIDITERKMNEAAIKESEEKYRVLIQTSPDSILVLDFEGKIAFANDKAAVVHKYSDVNEIIGLDARCLIVPEETAHIYANLERVLTTGKPVFDEFVFVKKDGERFYADLNLSLVCDSENKPTAVIGVARDISERKENEFELEKYRHRLEDLVKERTARLEEVNSLLESEIRKQKEAEVKVIRALEKEKELNILKSEFISTASHEFRTPLATILSSTELISRYWEKSDKEKILNHADRIKKSIRYLTGLLDDVLLISRSEAGKIIFNPQQTDLIKLCEAVYEETKSLITEKHILHIDLHLGNGEFFVDEKLIKHILTNLLSNAVKFSVNGGAVDFSARADEKEIIFEVNDQGIGISEEDKNRVYEPFSRGGNIGAIRGTGLGMSIIKRSVELHKGNISFDSKVNKGTKFTVHIPVVVNGN